MLKVMINLILVMAIPQLMLAQSIADVQKMMYYERYNSAEDSLHKIIKHEPGNPQAWYLLAQAYLEKDKYLQAMDTLAMAPQDVKATPIFKVALAHVLFKNNDSTKALQLFESALDDTRSKDPQVLQAVANAEINVKAGNAIHAVELLEKAIKKDKNKAALYVLLGDAYRKLGDGSNAYKAYANALESDGQYAAAQYKIGKIYTSQKNPSQYLTAFERAVTMDSMYAPALYELYYHYYFVDASRAKYFLEKYIAASDPDFQNDYLYADVLFALKEYKDAIKKADNIISAAGQNVQPRLYKLEAYCHDQLDDSLTAAKWMNKYFEVQADSALVAADYKTMGDIYANLDNKEDSACYFYERAAALEKDSLQQPVYYKKISGLYKKIKDYKREARWLGRYYLASPNTSNVDLFNWGLAAYLAKDFAGADSVFAMYEKKYPNEEFGYYWRARSNAGMDTAMEKGLAIPHYLTFIETFKSADTVAVTKKHLIEAYGYVAAYKANVEKDFESSLNYFDRLLALDPDNDDAKRYARILKKNLNAVEKPDGSK